jgi:hypothetical protein
VKIVVLSLFGLLPLLSSTITVGSNGFTLTATATLTSPETYAEDSVSYSQSYVLSVTGGTGTGWAFPSFTLIGATNESPYVGIWDRLGAVAQMHIGRFVAAVGDEYGSAFGAPPLFSCGPNAQPFFCGIPFTFDVPQTITVQASVEAALQPGPRGPSSFGETVSGSVVFNSDSLYIQDSQGRSDQAATAIQILAPAPSAISVPEPASWALAMATFLAVLLRARRTQH